ncbi:hypothetical protein C2857_006581 [Epichloe festucae Fl1]|uniref:Uncharacterized protein n=1 Tax=Epichloe festucae (strain Fl1) TaxID=877507 RepID=A0A7S9KTK9_EPIFF|nr:hypothetical protein C2857_006581 [Epichloe festucae Fl1]
MDVQRRKQAESLVLRASRACGIQARREDVQIALNDAEHGPLFVEWVSLHLGSDTLLSADELQIYMELDKRGRVDQLADSHDLAEVQAVTEDDLRLAVEQLKRSTENINKQTETLRQQQDALSRLVKKQAEDTARREELERVQKRKKEVERTQLTREVERITQHVSLRLAELEQEGSSLNNEVSTFLESDDRLLSSLQKLGWELDQPDPDEAQAVDKLRETCMRLIKTTVETVRTRLDTAYLETLVTAERSGAVKPATREEVTELQEEVESLYSEILSVAQMSTEQQHLEPALQAIAAKSGQSLGKTVSSLKYTDECLRYLQERMARLHAHVESHKSYRAAAEAMMTTARAELAVDATPTSTVSKQTIPVSPVRTRSNTSGARARPSSSGIQEESALETLLSSLAVSLPSEEESPRARVNAISKAVAERARKCDEVAKGAQESLEITTRAHLSDTKLALQLLRDSLLAKSPFGEVKLVDPDIEGSILVLQQEVEKAKEKLRSLEGQSATARSVKKEEFVRRWGS